MFAGRIYLVIVLLGLHLASKAEVDPIESVYLRNVQQITFPSMGFEKAGESYFSPDGKTLIFQAVPAFAQATAWQAHQQEYQIYTIDLQDGEPHLISPGPQACTCAFFRPDGKKIIFASSHQAPSDEQNDNQQVPGYQRDSKNYLWEFTPYMNIYQANPDGSDLVPLTTGQAYSAECAYSHDGTKIVFASNSSGHMNLYMMNADGSNVQQLTHTTDIYNGGPFFSPDDTTIIYRADHAKKHHLQIYSLNIKDGKCEQLTTNDAVNWAPFWHPNGNVIAFTSSLHGHHQYEIYLLNIKTKKLHRLTHDTTFDGLPSFNKDGTKITWTSKRGPDKTSQVFVADFVMPENL